MRWIVVLLGLAFSFGACTLGPPGAAGGAGGGDAGSTCAQEECSTCLSCAAMGPCMAFNDACNNDSDCIAIEQCVQLGTDAQTCYSNTPNGVADYQNFAHCSYCTECPAICTGFYTC